MKTIHLKWLARRLPKRNNKWFAALEQSGLSASNFFYSLVIIKFAGVSELGVFTFWFVVCQFMAMLTMGLATRQMVLEFSDKTSKDQRAGFWTSCSIVVAMQVGLVLVLSLLVRFYPPSENALEFWFGLALYSASFNIAELYRQFYYMSSRQRQSLWFSGLSLGLGGIVYLLIVVTGATRTPELSAFWFLALGNLLYALLATRSALARGGWNAFAPTSPWALCLRYWRHGVPATGGMLVTWMQNQSVTPFLMFMFGPLSVGYYSVARMIVTPVNMVTTGLAKSALPQIRRAFGNGNLSSLNSAVQAHCRTSMRIVYSYVGIVGLGWIALRVMDIAETGSVLVLLFVATLFVMILSNYRFWISQNFVVQMQYGTLLRLGIIAGCATVTTMLIGGLVFKSAIWVVAAPAVGEIILIWTLGRRLNNQLNNVAC